MSIITDGMAQVHSDLPWQKNLVDSSFKLNQHLQGVLEHGQTINIFRVFENLPLDANHGIHSLLMVLERRYTNIHYQTLLIDATMKRLLCTQATSI